MWLASLDRARDGGQRAGDEGSDLAGERQHPRGDALQDGQRVGQVARPAGWAHRDKIEIPFNVCLCSVQPSLTTHSHRGIS